MRGPLPYKEIPMPDWFSEKPERTGYWNTRMRLLFYDPKEVYERVGDLIDPNKRSQGKLNTAILFPKRADGICRCGCENKSESMWHSQECSNFAYRVYAIICYGTQTVKKLMTTYYGDTCQREGCGNKWSDIDHIIPVKHGGGGCWLSNFLPLCKECHKDKTKRDFKWGQYKEPAIKNQAALNFDNNDE